MCSKKKGVKVAKIVALVGLGVLGVGGIIIGIPQLGLLAGNLVFAAVGLGSAATMGSLVGGYALYRDERYIQLEEESKKKQIKINQLTEANTKNDNELIILEERIETTETKNKSYLKEYEKKMADSEKDQEKIDELERANQRLQKKANQLEQEKEENGGNGYLNSKDYSKLYYGSYHLQNYLQTAVMNHLGGYTCSSRLLLARSFQNLAGETYRVMVLPPVTSRETGLQRLAFCLNASEFIDSLSGIENLKLVFPYLDLDAGHWHTAEVIINRNSPTDYKITIYLHDPRGGGQAPTLLIRRLDYLVTEKIKTINSQANIQFEILGSPYKTCRQSKPDKISCGPIVGEEVILRIQDKSLDRCIPYEFGTSEIVHKQKSELDSLQEKNALSLIESRRYQFLSNHVSGSFNSISNQSNEAEVVLVNCKIR